MNIINEYNRYQNKYSPFNTDIFSLTTERNSKMNLTYSNSFDYHYYTLAYQILLTFICICLCVLTIMGNLFVLITFRRMRTVSRKRE